jgi:hypothetical protein
MVAKNLTLPHQFVCLSNVHVKGVGCIPLEDDLPGWWSKIELFKHDFGRTLYLDLDTLPVGSLDEIVNYPAEIAFSPPHHVLVGQPEPTKRPGLNIRYQTSCMVWTPPAGVEIFKCFHESTMRRLNGDQDWIAELNPGYALMPKEWFGKIKHCPDGPKHDMKVVFGGAVKNDDSNYKWVKDVWLGNADKISESLRV